MVAAMSVASALFLLSFVFPGFLSLRARYSSETGNAVADLHRAIEAPVPDDFREKYRQNMASRPMIVRFNCRVYEGYEWHDPMWGRAFFSSLLWAIPRPLSPGKIGGLQTEQAIQEHFGLPLHDTSANWPAAGLADFWLPGCLFAGLLLGAVLLAVEDLAARACNAKPFLAACAVGGMMDVAISVEAEPIIVFTQVRSLLVIVVVSALLSPAPRPACHTEPGSRWLDRQRSS